MINNEVTFASLGVKEEIVKALKEQNIYNPTNIQEQAIPLVHKGHDLVGISRTGSGKTLSFGVPLLEQMEAGRGIQGLVLAPTREIANQISQEMQKWSKYLNISIATIFGGVAMGPQERAMERSEVVVGTPGRVLDHLGRGNLKVDALKCFVLDEADKMVEMGFIEDIEQVASALPAERQIMLFGATISSEIDYFKQKYMHNVAKAEAELHVKEDLLKQFYYNVRTHEKFSLLVHLLKVEAGEAGRVIIFCSKRSTVDLVHHNLRENGVKAEMLHGKMTQNKRLHVIERFNGGKTHVLVASAVAARGLDIQDVTHVYNYDLPRDPQEYVHRVGRTARAGQSGKAITLLAPSDHGFFHAILDRYPIDVEELSAGEFKKVRFSTQIAGRGGSGRGRTGHGFRGRSRHFGNGGGRSGGRSGGRGGSGRGGSGRGRGPRRPRREE